MPYEKNSDINKNKRRGMTRHGQTIYRKAFNNALKHYGDEGTAHAVANSAVTKSGERKKKKMESTDKCEKCGERDCDCKNESATTFTKIVEGMLHDVPLRPNPEPPTSCEYWRGDGFCGVNALVCPHLESTFKVCKIREDALYAARVQRRM